MTAEINQYQIPKSKYLKLINNAIISLDKNNILRAINYQNNKMFWKNDTKKYFEKMTKIGPFLTILGIFGQ